MVGGAERVVGGSSLGAVLALYATQQAPALYARQILLSPFFALYNSSVAEAIKLIAGVVLIEFPRQRVSSFPTSVTTRIHRVKELEVGAQSPHGTLLGSLLN